MSHFRPRKTFNSRVPVFEDVYPFYWRKNYKPVLMYVIQIRLDYNL